MEALQYSVATASLHFDRRPESIRVTWTPDGGAALLLAVDLSDGDATASAKWTLTSPGRLTVRFGPDDQTAFETRVTVTADRPPTWGVLAGWPAARRSARPGEPLLFDVHVRDDVAVASVALEYRRNDAPAVRTLPLPEVDGVVSVAWPPGFAVGDVLHARLVATDNRKDARYGLTPQRVTCPPTGWAEFVVARDAEPLGEQLANWQRDEITATLTRIEANLRATRADLAAARPGDAMSFEVRVLWTQAAERLESAGRAAQELAGGLRVGGPLDGLREPLAVVASESLSAHGGLLSWLRRTDPEPGEQQLDAADAHADKALTVLGQMPAEVAAATERRLAAGRVAALAGVAGAQR